jgi:hypothetical protein
MAKIHAGAARARIVLPGAPAPVDGFDGEHDPLRVRVLVLDDGTAPVAVAVVDRSLPPEAHPGICRVLARVTRLPAERVLLCVGHTIAAGGRLAAGESLLLAVEDAVAWAAFAARSTCRPARLGRDPGARLDRVEDADGNPIALLLPNDGPITADAVEHDHHDRVVALFLTARVAAQLSAILTGPD